jgi:dolichol-phosphate mannosyltransferase
MSAHEPVVVVLIPTYNEAENIELMLGAVDRVMREMPSPGYRALVVDDESPDGTGALVTSHTADHPEVLLLSKPREGLGRAMIAGYEYAMSELRADVIVSLDCDFQWDPADIPRLLAEVAGGADVAVGSRHAPGGRMDGWSRGRRLTHWVANTFFATIVAGRREVGDLNGNFRAIRVAGVLDRVALRELPVRGYAFFNLMIYALSRVGAKFAEVPITFRWRERGETKVSLTPRYFGTFVRDTAEYIRLCLWIRRDRVRRRRDERSDR